MSDVWKLFQKIQDNDNVVISINCQLCEAEYGTATSTSTLRRHLISFHSSVYTSNNKQQRQTNLDLCSCILGAVRSQSSISTC